MREEMDLGPFEPGFGRLPPYLAGRESEQAVLRGFLRRLQRGRPAPSDVVLYGPRGNGKTVLLAWLEQEAAVMNAERGEESGREVRTLWMTPSEASTVEDLIAEFAPSSWLDRFRVSRAGVPGVVEVSLDSADPPPGRMLREALEARVREGPLVLLLDEAHTLDPTVGRALLNASQQVGRKSPFVMVLAGTPDLSPHLARINATFVSRAEHLRLGRLGRAAATEAIRRPLADGGVSISDELSRRVFKDHHGYPFFVQHWGRELWWRARSRGHVVAEDCAAAAQAVERVKGRYYEERYEEMKAAGLLGVAREVAEAFRAPPADATVGFEARPLVEDHELDAAIRRGLGSRFSARRAARAQEALRRLGYIWRTGVRETWEPGIPNLMAHVWSVPAGAAQPDS